ncbi:HypC/HybG/HupF family hydrogenase formation chaperone [Hydrogenophaga soli]|nr:HypC/HybG/HupF family hydrogenase formation chaperone [Burkholderiaceae bacterium]
MCLAIPARVVERLEGDQATVDLGGIRKTISLALVPEAQVGDYVIVHVGHAIGLLDPEEAERTLALFAELSEQQSAEQNGAAP